MDTTKILSGNEFAIFLPKNRSYQINQLELELEQEGVGAVNNLLTAIAHTRCFDNTEEAKRQRNRVYYICSQYGLTVRELKLAAICINLNLLDGKKENSNEIYQLKIQASECANYLQHNVEG